MQVALLDRRREASTLQHGADYLYSQGLPPDFPPVQARQKWQRRGREEADDGTAAPGTWSSFLWAGGEPGLVPWGVLKGAWRKEDSPPCPNCDGPTILTGWG